MEKKIIILSGDVGEGKTTAILDWIKSKKKRVHGILMPVKNTKRFFFNPYMDVSVPAEAARDKRSPELIFEIGKFKFSKQSFKIAGSWLKMKPPLNTDYLIIDEIGPLELREEGLEPDLTDFLEKVKRGDVKQTVILVVRKSLLDQVIDHYELNDAHLINKEELINL